MDKNFMYSYFKMRKNFGKQPRFCETSVTMLDSINPDRFEQRFYCLRNPVHSSAQTTKSMSENYVNTRRVILRDQGINHAEGGWPKDVNINDEEATARYRRKFERDDTYVDAVLGSYKKLNHYINQNNAIEIYDMYFREMKPEMPVEKSYIRMSNAFRDPDERPIGSISWTNEEEAKLVVSYCNKKFPVTGKVNKNFTCYVWDIENPNEPCAEFSPPSACWQAVTFPGNPNIVIGGLDDGRVCIFDIRSVKEPSLSSPMHLAHRDPVSALLFITSRLNTDFFSGSTDGKCMWWDVRNLSMPTDSLIMSIRNINTGEPISLANAEGVSALQYDRSFPTKFLCGTDTGFVINVNRKGKTHREMMSGIFEAHNGPVKAVHRSPCTSKIFITCGDWAAHVWSDDVHTAPIVTGTAHRKQITDVVWAPQRVSSYMTVCADGKFRYWDLIRKYREPNYILPVSKHPLLKVVPNEEGRLVATGDAAGVVHLLSLSENLVTSGSRDKQIMSQCLDREGRREHILETRIKEIKLKLKTDTVTGSPTQASDEQAWLKSVEDEYKRVIAEEIRRTGITPYSGGQKMRKR